MNQSNHNLKIYIALLGLDQHEAGALSVSRMLVDAGVEVVYGGRFNVPATIVRAAVEEDVDVIGLSCHSWEYIYYIDELIAGLREADAEIPIIIGGSVITGKDGVAMLAKGIKATFGPSAKPDDIIAQVIGLAEESRAARAS